MSNAGERYREAAKLRPRLNKPCCTCGKAIRSGTYHTIGGPGVTAGPPDATGNRPVWNDGLYQHICCRVGTARWYDTLGAPVKGFEALYDAEADAKLIRWYAEARFISDKPTLEEEIEEDVSA